MIPALVPPVVEKRPRSRLAVLSFWLGLATFGAMLFYAVSGNGLLLFLSLAGSAAAIGTALLGACVTIVRRCERGGLGYALVAGCLGLVSPFLVVGFG